MPATPFHLLCCCAAALLGASSRADDLPSPDAMWLGARIVPRSLVDGFRDGIVRDALKDAAGRGSDESSEPAPRARAAAILAPALDEAFPEELLAGLAAQFLGRHYSADELRALRAHEESPLGRKLRDFYRRAGSVVAADPAARDRARDELARATFTEAERKDIDAFAASPLAKKGDALALTLAGFFLEQLDRRWAEVRPAIEPRLRAAAKAALGPDAPGR
jgi:hypothetical protein